MGGAPQEQMAQQQMPPQQEGQGSEQDQIMQLIQAYADAMGISPEEIIQELQQMDPQEQKQAIDQMAQELQGGQQAQGSMQEIGAVILCAAPLRSDASAFATNTFFLFTFVPYIGSAACVFFFGINLPTEGVPLTLVKVAFAPEGVY
jgi:hypothetical protein